MSVSVVEGVAVEESMEQHNIGAVLHSLKLIVLVVISFAPIKLLFFSFGPSCSPG